MLARLIWALVFVLVVVVIALLWTVPSELPQEQPAVGASLRACAENPQQAGCR
jgi:hypothetical protein